MAVQIQYRRGEAAVWTAINPTLALGEPGFETDTGKIKVGTGADAWNDLVYTAANSFLNEEGAPDASLGKVGDLYLDTTTYRLYGPKTATVGDEWGTDVYLTGNTVRTGVIAPDASIGRDGDFYIDTAANQIYGPKTATVGDEWGSPTNLQVVNIDDLNDVDTSTAAPQAGEALVWDDLSSVWKPGPAGAEASGSVGQIQYNDGVSPTPGLAASTDLTWDDTSKQLSVGGDINLDDGVIGSFSTTVQSVTPTVNRTISFPDATGTVALVSGADGTIQYNDAGTLKGNSDFTVDLDWNDASTVFTGLKLNVTNGAGGLPEGNSDSNLLDLQAGGTSKFTVAANTNISFTEGTTADRTAINLPSYSHIATENGRLWFQDSGGTKRQFFERGLELWNIGYMGISPSDPVSLSADVRLYRDAEGIFAQRNNNIAQTYRLYNTWGNNGANFERLSFNWDTNVFKITSEAGGTGTVRGIQLGSAATEPVALFGATPVVQPTTAVSSATVAGGGGTAVDDATTFNGYTLAQVVQALQNLGILA